MSLNPYHLKSELQQLEKRFQQANKQLTFQSKQIHTIQTENQLLKHKIIELNKRPTSELEIELKNAFQTIEKLQYKIMQLKIQLQNQNQNRQILERLDTLSQDNWNGNQAFIIQKYQEQLSLNQDLVEENSELKTKVKKLQNDNKSLTIVNHNIQQQNLNENVQIVSKIIQAEQRPISNDAVLGLEIKQLKTELAEEKQTSHQNYYKLHQIEVIISNFNEMQYNRSERRDIQQQIKDLTVQHMNFINETEHLRNENITNQNNIKKYQMRISELETKQGIKDQSWASKIFNCEKIIYELDNQLKQLRTENGTRKCESFGLSYQLGKLKEQLGQLQK
ncbi:hypothetical protein SS50377_20498 [Spironucleus salmonicida]|uniref:Uncharacterized protein n=1 Tax=Spironucleus salmonicida TaxID=348837 RepID=V6LHL7_9EUKA|nr:hypothetical protein SS50377_20498 [Spironucleus salmonicida]|eukprot:EST43793.1 Hypothetical protein SS50377_16410 [Spironucleus salmonicida]